MKKLQEFLEGLSNKTRFVVALLGLVNIAVMMNLIPAEYTLWADFAAGVMLFGFQAFAPTGILTRGQTTVYWGVTILTLLVSIAQLVMDSSVFDKVPDAIISKIITVLTALLYYWKYINGVNLTNKVAILKLEDKIQGQLNPGSFRKVQLSLPEAVTKKYVLPDSFCKKHNLAA